MLFVQERISHKNMAFHVSIGCVRLARYWGKCTARVLAQVHEEHCGLSLRLS